MDASGTHPLSCRFCAGCIPRHSALSDVVQSGRSAAEIPSMLEPSGLDRGDGKRTDGITVYPYSRGRCLFLDATCVNTFVSSNLIRAALVADAAEVRKIAKYAELDRRFIFQPVTVETSGAMGKLTIQFFYRFGSPTGRATSGSARERFPVPESIFGCSQRERLQHFSVVP